MSTHGAILGPLLLLLAQGTCASLGSHHRRGLLQLQPGASATQLVVTGPYGDGPSGAASAYDDSAFSNNGSNPITTISWRSGSWMDSIQLTYGQAQAPRRGGPGGQPSSFPLAAGETITGARVSHGLYVDGLVFTTSWGRRVVLGSGDRGPNPTDATPAPLANHTAQLLYIRGVAGVYLEQISLVWSQVPSPAPPNRTVSSPVSRLPPVITVGPIGYSGSDSVPFDDRPPAGARLSSVQLNYGSWVDAITMVYNGTQYPQHGGNGGGLVARLDIAGSEYVDMSIVHYGSVMYGMTLGKVVSNGTRSRREVATLAYQSATAYLGSPCPVGLYRLAAVRGTSNRYVNELTFEWRLRNPNTTTAALASAAAAAQAAGWRCTFGAGLVRTGTPAAGPSNSSNSSHSSISCLSMDGVSCLQGDCASMLPCAQGPLPAPLTTASCDASPSSPDFQDPSQWCVRAAGSLGLRLSQPTPIKVVFLLVNVCDAGSPYNVTALEDLLYDDPTGLQRFWGDMSFGRARFNRNTSAIHAIDLPCSTFSRGVCSNSGANNWFDYVEANAAALGVPNYQQYNRRVFIFPKDLNCSDIGFAFGNVVFINAGFMSRNILKHELGHTLGLPHSSRGSEEYGDSSDPMGYCERCSYNAPQLVYLGWAVPIARLSAANLPVGVVRSYTLPALTATRTSTLQITVNWPLLGVNSTAQFNGTYFVSFRRPVGQDVGLPAEYVGVSVHAVAAPGRNPYLQQVLQEPQELWLSMHAGLAVARASGGGANATSATVRVCRWTTSPVAQCPGLLAGTGGL